MKRALLAVVLLVAGCTASPGPTPEPDPTPPPFVGCAGLFTGRAQLPDVELTCITGGESMRVGELAGPVVINFWGSWCGPCRDELPVFQRFADTGKVKVIGIATETTRVEAISLATDLGVRMPTLLDRYGSLRRQLGEINMPLTVFVDGDGKVTSHAGPPLDDAELAQLTRERLGIG